MQMAFEMISITKKAHSPAATMLSALIWQNGDVVFGFPIGPDSGPSAQGDLAGLDFTWWVGREELISRLRMSRKSRPKEPIEWVESNRCDILSVQNLQKKTKGRMPSQNQLHKRALIGPYDIPVLIEFPSHMDNEVGRIHSANVISMNSMVIGDLAFFV